MVTTANMNDNISHLQHFSEIFLTHLHLSVTNLTPELAHLLTLPRKFVVFVSLGYLCQDIIQY